jgi:hypothetical protein
VPARATEAPRAQAGPPPAAGGWEGFLAELGKSRGALAALLARAGASALVEGSDGRLRLRLGGLSPEEERLVQDRHNQRACEQAAAGTLGRGLVLELASSAPRRAAERASSAKDPMTQRMLQEFEGTVEDLS